MSQPVCTFEDVVSAGDIVHQYLTPVPLMRSIPLEYALDLNKERRVWIKDYGWTPVGSFKVYGALNWVFQNRERIGDAAIVAHSSGNFASGIAFAGQQFGKRVIVVMPDTAPETKFTLTRSFGAEIRTYDISKDHVTGERDLITEEISRTEHAIQASPYDDRNVIAGNGVGGLEIVLELQRNQRHVSHFFCPVSGGGLMAGHAVAVGTAFPESQIIGVEPSGADDFSRSLAAGERVRIEQPIGICDGLLSYDVGVNNWPILQKHVSKSVTITDDETRAAMRWLYDNHGLRTEPSGAIAVASLFSERKSIEGDGDIVVVVSGRNVDEKQFRKWIEI